MWAKLTNFSKDVRAEFDKVSWPTREELLNSTYVVLQVFRRVCVSTGLFDLAYTLSYNCSGSSQIGYALF